MNDAAQPAPSSPANDAPPIDTSERHLTLRSVLTGAIIGGTLALCNVYAGLKIGWGMNMSIAALLIAYGFWVAMRAVFGTRVWGMHENNVNQSGASAAASISSAGLVSAIPALTMLTGYEWDFPSLALWTFSCSILGVLTAALFRNQMIVRDKLPFAAGIAAAETLREMYAHGKEAIARLMALVGAAVAAAAFKVLALVLVIPRISILPLELPVGGALAGKGIAAVTPLNLTLALDPSLLLFGSGMIVGLRTGVWMLIGAIVAWGIVGMQVLEAGAAAPGAPGASWFPKMVEWLLWPGVAMLVTSALTSLAFSAPAFVRAFRGGGSSSDQTPPVFPPKVLWFALAGLGALVVIVGSALFGMAPHIGALAVALTMLLAVVALRVTGETNITPVGPMGKVTQLTFGLVDPGNVATNLMAANVTGGSASQAGDMMYDLKTGYMLGTSPRAQVISQIAGVMAGALTGSAIYLVLVDNPSKMLLTSDWPAPAVAQWKAVAEVMQKGFDSLPAGVPTALLIAAIAGVVLAAAERLVPPRVKPFVPSPTAIGIAFCVPGWNAISFFFGGVVNAITKRFWPNWHSRFLIVVAAGLIVGESLAGLTDAIYQILATAVSGK